MTITTVPGRSVALIKAAAIEEVAALLDLPDKDPTQHPADRARKYALIYRQDARGDHGQVLTPDEVIL